MQALHESINEKTEYSFQACITEKQQKHQPWCVSIVTSGAIQTNLDSHQEYIQPQSLFFFWCIELKISKFMMLLKAWNPVST